MYFGFTGRSSEITSETRVRNINFVSTVDTGIKYADGIVGVGTTTPEYDLDVTGDINFTGNVLKNGVIQSFGIDIIPLIPTLKWSNVTPYSEVTLVQLAFDDQKTGTTFTGSLSGTQLNAVAQPKIATRLANSAGGYIELTNGGWNLAGTAYWEVTTGDNWSATFDIFISPYYVGQAPADDIRFIFFAPNAPATNDHATGSGGHGGHYIECNFFNADVISLKDTTDSTVVSASTTLQLNGWMPVTMTYVNGVLSCTIQDSSGITLNTTTYDYGTTLSSNYGVPRYFGFSGRVGSNYTSTTRVRNYSLTTNTTITFTDDITYTKPIRNRVGIGTITPAYELDVVGDINFTGNIRRNGVNADLSGLLQAPGDIIYADANSNPATLPIGASTGHVLTIINQASGQLGWQAASGGSGGSGVGNLQDVTVNGSTTDRTIEFLNTGTSLSASGNVLVTGNVTAQTYYGDASNMTGITTLAGLTTVQNDLTSNVSRIANLESNKIISYSSTINSITKGSIIYASANNTLTTLPLGIDGNVLRSNGTDIVWGVDGLGPSDTIPTPGLLTFQQELVDPSPSIDDHFGGSVSISSDGMYAIVGASGDDTGVGDRGAAHIFVRSGGGNDAVTGQRRAWTWTHQQKLVHSFGSSSDMFGHSVAISGDGMYAAVGVYGGSGYTQKVFIFVRSGSGNSPWVLQQELTDPNTVNGDQFGHTVSISSNGMYVIVGAKYDDVSGNSNSGAAHIFIRSGSGNTPWSHQQELTDPNASGGDNFGRSVDISSDGVYAIIGASNEAAHIFTRSGNGSNPWSHQQKLVDPNTVANDQFGLSVAISGNGMYAIVGAEEDGGSYRGAAHVFNRHGDLWTHQQKLTDPNSAINEYFGKSVSISTDGVYVVIGCPLDSSGASFWMGSAHVYARSRTSWAYKQKIVDPNVNSQDKFGSSVTISGNETDGLYIISGSPFDDVGGSNAGAAHIFHINPLSLSTRISTLEIFDVDTVHNLASNVARIAALESGGGSGSGTSPGDVTRITNLETSNTAIWSNLVSNVTRIEELETSNTAIWSNLASNVARIEDLETNGIISNSSSITSISQGDLIYASADSTLQTLTVGTTTGHVLKVSAAGIPEWAAETGGSGGGQWAIVNTNDIHYSTGNVGIGTTTPTANLDVVGSTTVSNAVTIGMTKTFTVTVGINNKYHIDGVDRPSLELHQGQTYIFDMSDISNAGHPLAFSTAYSGSSSSYTPGVVSNHDTFASGTAGSKVTFSVPLNAPSSIYYYCTVHGAGMGSSTASSISSTAELFVSGRVVSTGLEITGTGGAILGGGTTAERPTNAVLGTVRYNSTTGFMEAYTTQGWGSIAQPPSVSGISPASVLLANTGTQVFTVTGGGFTSGSTVQLVGADGTEYTVFDTTIVSATQITFKMGVDGATGGYDKAQRPYTLKVVSSSGLATLSSATIGFGGLSWTSPADNAVLNYVEATASTETLVATDDLGGSDVTFSIVSGTLNGLSLGSATASPATFGGSATGVATNSVVFRITDNVSGATADRTFSVDVTAAIPTPTGETTFTATGTSTWVAPAGVNAVSVVCVGGGGGGGQWTGSGGAGGGLAYKNNISVTPGTSYTVIVGAGGLGQAYNQTAQASGSTSTGNGGTSSFTVPGGLVVGATGGEHGCSSHTSNRTVAGQPTGGAPTGTYDGGGTGGTCEGPFATNATWSVDYSSGGGGAGGYSGTGGKGAGTLQTPVYPGTGAALTSATSGSGGGGGGGGSRRVGAYGYSTFSGSGGGGVGLLGIGSDGVAGTDALNITPSTQAPTNNGGGGGSGGDTGNLATGSGTTSLVGGVGGLYGGGGGPAFGNSFYSVGGAGGNGAVRIIWGAGRSFPSNAA